MKKPWGKFDTPKSFRIDRESLASVPTGSSVTRGAGIEAEREAVEAPCADTLCTRRRSSQIESSRPQRRHVRKSFLIHRLSVAESPPRELKAFATRPPEREQKIH